MIAEVDRFPIGIMRVLVVDDDPTRLMLLDGLLKKCQYQVTTATQARSALRMLRENRNRFDLIISDVHTPDMDGFKLLELVGLEMDLPVIKATPKKILDLINVEGLTRENVASHFLKYRLYLKRIIFMQANMSATFEGTDCSYIRMGPIDEFWALTRSGKLPNAALSSGMSLHGLDPSSLAQPAVSSAGQNTSFYHNLEFAWFVVLVLVFLFQMFITTHN